MVRRNGLKRPICVRDTALDCPSAREAGVPFLHAAYGFGTVEGTPAIRSLAELPEAFERLAGGVRCSVFHRPGLDLRGTVGTIPG